MGSGDWLKKIVGLKKLKNGKPKYLKASSVFQNANGINKNNQFQMNSTNLSHHVSNGNPGSSVEDLAATRIQSASRVYRDGSSKDERELRSLKKRLNSYGSAKEAIADPFFTELYVDNAL